MGFCYAINYHTREDYVLKGLFLEYSDKWQTKDAMLT